MHRRLSVRSALVSVSLRKRCGLIWEGTVTAGMRPGVVVRTWRSIRCS
jgi:hypothetical protein